ncbi:hypothetical protein ABZZ79_12450 [Streptomyces sp. NPDC006458]|uniref:hypothetical protein n=1 Tax=Streptomyces sp. NPDC006458 TaxID=3154302 RepID=UPI0033B046ED
MTERTSEAADMAEATGEAERAERAEVTEVTEVTEADPTNEAAAARPDSTAVAPAEPAGLPPAPAPASPPQATAPRDRRVLRAVTRWVAAVAVFAAVGAGTAYGIASMERGDVPGLATESDGRWDYPELTLPPLPAGSPRPFAEGNRENAHHADLRALVLPAPAGAKEDKALRGEDGWLETKDYLAEYADDEHREQVRQKLVDTGLRHIAARGWTTPDGVSTRIYLLHFATAEMVDGQIASDTVSYSTPSYLVRGVHDAVHDEEFPEAAAVSGIKRVAYTEPAPHGPEHVRLGYLAAGDVHAVIIQSLKGGEVPAVPFQQTVVLQSQLLG